MKRKISLLLSICLVLSMVFSGCAKKETDMGSQETNTKKEATKKEDSKSSEDSIYTESGSFPIVKEKIELSFLAPSANQIIDYNTNNFTKLMEEKTNVHIKWELVPQESKAKLEKINLVLASGNYPDVFYGLDLGDDLEALYGVEQGVFIPLNDLIEEHGPNFKKNVLEKYPSTVGQITALDGNIYGLPSINECYHCSHAQKYWINKHWLDTLGLDMPTTTDEFYEVLKAFKEKDPNQNGKKDEIPMSGSDTWMGKILPFFMNSFILDPGMYSKDKLIVNDGMVMTNAKTDEYKEGLRYLRKLYEEELIYKGSFTQKGEQLKQIVTNPDVEVMGGYPGGFSGLILEQPVNPERYRHYVAMAPLKGPEGVQQSTFIESSVYPGEFLITNTCEYPEAAMRWADYLYSDDGQHDRGGMEEGVDFEWAQDGDLGLNGLPAKIRRITPYSNEPQNKGHAWVGVEWLPAENRMSEAVPQDVDLYTPKGFEKMLYIESKEKHEPYVPKNVKRLPVTKLTADENDELQVIRAELNKYIEESRLKFLLGEWDIDADWDNYIAGLKSIGIERYEEVYQVAYDRQYNK